MASRHVLLPLLGGAFLLVGAVQVLGMVGSTATPAPAAVEGGLLAGCTDIPEAVALADLLAVRSDRMRRYEEALVARQAEIASATAALADEARRLKALSDGRKGRKDDVREDVAADIQRLVSVYDQMKPANAAEVLGALPSEFAAEILMRVDPAVGAKIIAELPPQSAALVTTLMGARSAVTR